MHSPRDNKSNSHDSAGLIFNAIFTSRFSVPKIYSFKFIHFKFDFLNAEHTEEAQQTEAIKIGCATLACFAENSILLDAEVQEVYT